MPSDYHAEHPKLREQRRRHDSVEFRSLQRDLVIHAYLCRNVTWRDIDIDGAHGMPHLPGIEWVQQQPLRHAQHENLLLHDDGHGRGNSHAALLLFVPRHDG
jgi:hypothetical protein